MNVFPNASIAGYVQRDNRAERRAQAARQARAYRNAQRAAPYGAGYSTAPRRTGLPPGLEVQFPGVYPEAAFRPTGVDDSATVVPAEPLPTPEEMQDLLLAADESGGYYGLQDYSDEYVIGGKLYPQYFGSSKLDEWVGKDPEWIMRTKKLLDWAGFYATGYHPQMDATYDEGDIEALHQAMIIANLQAGKNDWEDIVEYRAAKAIGLTGTKKDARQVGFNVKTVLGKDKRSEAPWMGMTPYDELPTFSGWREEGNATSSEVFGNVMTIAEKSKDMGIPQSKEWIWNKALKISENKTSLNEVEYNLRMQAGMLYGIESSSSGGGGGTTTVADLASPYVGLMEQTLELVNVKTSDPLVQEAVSSKMTATDFVNRLKDDNRYQYTFNAWNEYGATAYQIAQSMGVG